MQNQNIRYKFLGKTAYNQFEADLQSKTSSNCTNWEREKWELDKNVQNVEYLKKFLMIENPKMQSVGSIENKDNSADRFVVSATLLVALEWSGMKQGFIESEYFSDLGHHARFQNQS